MNNITVKLVDALGEEKKGSLSYSEKPPWLIEFHSVELGDQVFTANDLFDCLLLLREFLEGKKWLILCNGARVDAYPSTLSREMSGGKKIYILKLGEKVSQENLVNLFDEAPIEKIGTIEEQYKYYKQCVGSISKKSAK